MQESDLWEMRNKWGEPCHPSLLPWESFQATVKDGRSRLKPGGLPELKRRSGELSGHQARVPKSGEERATSRENPGDLQRGHRSNIQHSTAQGMHGSAGAGEKPAGQIRGNRAPDPHGALSWACSQADYREPSSSEDTGYSAPKGLGSVGRDQQPLTKCCQSHWTNSKSRT